MNKGANRFPLGWIIALMIVVLAGALPAAWAAPLAQPARQTVPTPTPFVTVVAETPTPVVTVVGDIDAVCVPVTGPGVPESVTIAITNPGSAPIQGCTLRIEGDPGTEFLLNGVVVSAPYIIDLPAIAPGSTYELVLDVQLIEDSDDVVPCQDYTVSMYLQCGDMVRLISQKCFSAPCPLLPEVGK